MQQGRASRGNRHNPLSEISPLYEHHDASGPVGVGFNRAWPRAEIDITPHLKWPAYGLTKVGPVASGCSYSGAGTCRQSISTTKEGWVLICHSFTSTHIFFDETGQAVPRRVSCCTLLQGINFCVRLTQKEFFRMYDSYIFLNMYNVVCLICLN